MKLQKLKNYTVFDIETAGLNPLNSGITCICAIDEKGDFFSRAIARESMTTHGTLKDEIELIFDFISWLKLRSFTTLITFNGRSFDIPFILSRLTYLLNCVPQQHIDLRNFRHMDLFDVCDKWVSLDSHAQILNLPMKSGTGYHAITLWKENRLDELKEYCLNDVKVTISVYLKLLELRE